LCDTCGVAHGRTRNCRFCHKNHCFSRDCNGNVRAAPKQATAEVATEFKPLDADTVYKYIYELHADGDSLDSSAWRVSYGNKVYLMAGKHQFG